MVECDAPYRSVKPYDPASAPHAPEIFKATGRKMARKLMSDDIEYNGEADMHNYITRLEDTTSLPIHNQLFSSDNVKLVQQNIEKELKDKYGYEISGEKQSKAIVKRLLLRYYNSYIRSCEYYGSDRSDAEDIARVNWMVIDYLVEHIRIQVQSYKRYTNWVDDRSRLGLQPRPEYVRMSIRGDRDMQRWTPCDKTVTQAYPSRPCDRSQKVLEYRKQNDKAQTYTFSRNYW